MFHHKPKQQLFVRLLSGEGVVILECNFNRLPLKEKVVLEKSVEFFSDPEPCYIHRSAVMVRLLSEIWEFLDDRLNQGIESIDDCEDLNLIYSYVNVENVKALYYKRI